MFYKIINCKVPYRKRFKTVENYETSNRAPTDMVGS